MFKGYFNSFPYVYSIIVIFTIKFMYFINKIIWEKKNINAQQFETWPSCILTYLKKLPHFYSTCIRSIYVDNQ